MHAVRVAVVALLVCASASIAQNDTPAAAPDPPSLPATLIGSNTPPSSAQQETIATYVGYWADYLTKRGTADAAKQARQSMVQKSQADVATDAFRTAYAKAIQAEMASLLSENHPLAVRLNVMIVAERVGRKPLMELAETALEDPNPAIRYWGVKTLRAIAVGGAPGAKGRKRVVAALKERLDKETSHVVVKEVLRTLGKLGTPAATKAVLNNLKSRVADLQREVDKRLRADVTGLAVLTEPMFGRAAGSEAEALKELRSFLVVVAQYVQVIARKLEAGEVPDSLRPAAHRLIRTGMEWFQGGLDIFDPNYTPRPALAAPVQNKKYTKLLKRVRKWVGTSDEPGILTKSKLNIPRKDLRVPKVDGDQPKAFRTEHAIHFWTSGFAWV